MEAPAIPLRAAIDIGTNSVLMLIARTDGTSLTRVEDHATITRLGQGVDATRALDPAAIARTLDCLRAYAARFCSLGVTTVKVVATSAVRDATNRLDFVEPAEAILGATVETVEGTREALLTFLGATAGLSLPHGTRVMTVDIGGGSTEVITGTVGGTPEHPRSLDIGSVRLTERLVHHDPPTPSEREAMRDATARALDTLGSPPGFDTLVGLAGAVTTAAALVHHVVPYDTARIHGSTVTLDELTALCDSLAGVPTAERARHPGLQPGRADVIVAGLEILKTVLQWAGADRLTVSDGGVRVGLLLTPA